MTGNVMAVEPFMGKYHRRTDEKGRVAIPPGLRRILELNPVLSAEGDGLYLYPEQVWKEVAGKYISSAADKKEAEREFWSRRFDPKKDDIYRVTLPSLGGEGYRSKDVEIAGVNDHIEIRIANRGWLGYIRGFLKN
jgi:DNA-binding transcriptional regulator/RsmH inhibitor MraZ